MIEENKEGELKTFKYFEGLRDHTEIDHYTLKEIKQEAIKWIKEIIRLTEIYRKDLINPEDKIRLNFIHEVEKSKLDLPIGCYTYNFLNKDRNLINAEILFHGLRMSEVIISNMFNIEEEDLK